MNQRLFAALDLPTPVLNSLAEVVQQLRTTLPSGSVRWVRPEGIHLTMRFYGETRSEQVPALQEALAQAANQVAPIELELSGLGIFPNLVAPRVIWVGLTGALDVLQTLNALL